MTAAHEQSRLPQLLGRRVVTDGGMETDLIFHHGVEMPCFAAFPLVESAEGRALLERYYDSYAAIARRVRAGLMLESPTWRANPDWGQRLGYSADALARVNRQAIALLAALRYRYRLSITDIVISGMIGPRGDGYRPGVGIDPADAAAYHRPKLEAFANAGADMATAYTLTDVGEATGIVRAAREVGLPVAIAFTVETDGRLPASLPLVDAVAQVDHAGGPGYFMVNCAHRSQSPADCARPARGASASSGFGPTPPPAATPSSTKATELDEGDPHALAATHHQPLGRLPSLSILGGCCRTDPPAPRAAVGRRIAPSGPTRVATGKLQATRRSWDRKHRGQDVHAHFEKPGTTGPQSVRADGVWLFTAKRRLWLCRSIDRRRTCLLATAWCRP